MTTSTAPQPVVQASAPRGRSRAPRRRSRTLRVIGIIVIVLVVLIIAIGVWIVSGWRDTGTTALRIDFDGAEGTAPDSSMWTIQTGGGGWGNNELQEYTTDAVALDGEGHLAVTATIPRDATTPTSGRLTTQGNWSFTYGTLSASIKLPDGQGLLPAFWLMGDSLPVEGWPAAGEIDIVETPNSTAASHHHVHGPITSTEKWSLASAVKFDPPLGEGFHTYSVERSPGRVVMSIDDQVVMDVSREDMPESGTWVFDERFHMLFSLAVGGTWPGDPDMTTPESAQMLIDWIAFEPAQSP